jgi:HEAT repeat protein
MPLKYRPQTRFDASTKAPAAALFAALLMLSAACLFGTAASAQRKANDNAAQKEGASSSRRVFVGRGSDTGSGSRVTIKSDDPLNDYSAYRSGDRFYVVLPKSAAGAVSKGSGKGYTDVQVQQRGDSVVVSYKVQPGAKPRVEQKFNRLDVVFDVKDGEGQPAATGRQQATQQQSSEGGNNAQQQQQQQQQQSQPQPRPTAQTPLNAATERRPGEVSAGTGVAGSTSGAAQPGSTEPQNGAAQTQAMPAATAQPGATAPAEPQIAQNQPPANIAPVTNPNAQTASTQTSVSLGTLLVNNWPIALFLALFVVGLGLVIFARRSSGGAPTEEEAAAVVTTTKTLDEARPARLKSPAVDADVVTAKGATTTATAATAASLVTAAAPLTGKKKKKKGKERRAEEARRAKASAESKAVAPELKAETPAPAEASASEVETPTEATVEAPPVVDTPSVVETPAEVEVSPVVESASAESEALTTAIVPASAAEEVEAAREEEASQGPAVVDEAVAEASPSVEASSSVEASLSSVEAAPSVEAASSPVVETGVVPAAAPDSDEVQAQTRRLLEGESYDGAVVGSRDSMARQMIGAELLSALAGRNVERRERARAAFVEHGYFDEKARDVREAAAPAERAAAARSLALVGDRAAAPHLIAALDDDSMEVRRASVEALGALREPTAVEPLEALLRREKKQHNRIPNRIIQHAIDTCRLAAVEEKRHAAEEARRAADEARRVAEAHAVETTEIAPVEAAPVEVEAAHAAESALVEEPATVEEAAVEDVALVEEVTRPAVEAATPETAVEVFAGETVAASTEEDAGAVAEAAPFETEQPVVDAGAFETRTAFDIQPADAHAPEVEAPEAKAPVFETEHVGEVPALDESTLAAVRGEAPTSFAESDETETLLAEPDEAETLLAESPVLESAVAEPFVSEPRPSEEPSLFAREPEAAPVEEESSAFAPFVSNDEPARAAEAEPAGEWIELDMSDLGSAGQEPSASAQTGFVFESSSGEAISEAPDAESDAQTATPDSHAFESSFESGGAAVEERGVEEASRPSTPLIDFGRGAASETAVERADEAVTTPLPSVHEKGVVPFDEHSIVPAAIQQRLASRDASVRASAITELSHVDTDEAFQQICSAFDDEAKEVRSAAARALYELRTDRAESFTRALREATSERRRSVGAAIASSGLASEAISQLTGESRDRTYEAFSLLFLMAKAGEVQPLVRAIEGHPNNEVRLAVVKLLALSGQKEILPAFRRLAVRGSLPTEVRSAVMEAIYQISSNQPTPA